MTKKKNKQDKPVTLNMSFEEAMQRLSKVDKSNVEANIKRNKNNKKD